MGGSGANGLMVIHGYLQCKFSIWLLNFACLNSQGFNFAGL